jgi:tetratricopeptide (TPR) repeat protein
MSIFVFIVLAVGVFSCPAFAQASENPARDLQIKAVQAAEAGQYDEARKYYLQEAETLLATGKCSEAGEVYLELGEIAQIHGEFSVAEGNYKRGLELLERTSQPNDAQLVRALDDRGWLYVTWGRFADGSRLLGQARTKADRAQPHDPALIRHLDTQAAYLVVAGKYSEAQKNWNRALEIGKMNYGPESPQYDNILVHFGQGSALYGDYGVAEQMFRRYLAIEGNSRDGSPSTTAHAVAAGELAHVYTELHKYSEAQASFDDATRILNHNPDQAPLVRSMVLTYLGDYYMVRGDWSNAQSQYREALRVQQYVLGENRAVATAMISLSKALKKLHLTDQAKDLTARAKAIFEAEKNPLRDQTVDVLALRRQ